VQPSLQWELLRGEEASRERWPGRWEWGKRVRVHRKPSPIEEACVSGGRGRGLLRMVANAPDDEEDVTPDDAEASKHEEGEEE
jgi:hypothetical protein